MKYALNTMLFREIASNIGKREICAETVEREIA